MYDGTKINHLSVSATLLLSIDRLNFALPINEQTGEVLRRPRRADDRGLTFTLIPQLSGTGYRVELKGSLHTFYNHVRDRAALGNSDQFMVDHLLTALDQLVMSYQIDPFNAKLNNIEFGVNVSLPFPVSLVLKNLVSYKNRPFTRDTRSDTLYYQCETQRYIVKLYDKGHQYGLTTNLLRVEVKVLRMEYLRSRGVYLTTLADLLNVANYGTIGALLVDTFKAIIFDDPTIDPTRLNSRERSIYENGRNPRFWHIPDDLTPTQANTHRQRLHRAEQRYRALLNHYRRGGDWQTKTAELIAQTWEQLTTVSDDLLTRIDQHRAAWHDLTFGLLLSDKIQAEKLEDNKKNPQNTDTPKIPNSCDGAAINPPETCHELTNLTIPVYGNFSGNFPENCHELTTPEKPHLSRINPLYLGVIHDTSTNHTTTGPGAIICPVTAVLIEQPRPGQRFVSATMLRNDNDLLTELEQLFTCYRKGSKEDQPTRTAHNARNVPSNERNNLRRGINKIHRQPTLFDVSQTLRLTADQQAALDYWKGTRFEMPI
ncbi:hypothetical protein [Spirosoma spitsbergense]|uniref:hypothetical protein n=1 Tax=Spirosoma spitsbergense TaxID=431554 RepID=UPI00036C03B1|nr:hypothetical protein [Spirosoma spitsbergense]